MKSHKESEVSLRELEYADTHRIRQWKDNASVLLSGYNYGRMGQAESRLWLRRCQGFRRQYYAVDLPQHPLIGFIGSKERDIFRGRAKLGIVFDPAYQSQGYGKQALLRFLELYFSDMRMKRIDLEVNQFNDRAIRLYESVGFRVIQEKTEMFEVQDLDFSAPELAQYREAFRREKGVWVARLWRMRKERT